MNIELFLGRHGKTWPLIRPDLVALLDASSPAHDADKLPIPTGKEQSETINAGFFSILSGYAKARRVISNLGGEEISTEPDDANFEKSHEQIFREENPVPPMPVPKGRKRK